MSFFGCGRRSSAANEHIPDLELRRLRCEEVDLRRNLKAARENKLAPDLIKNAIDRNIEQQEARYVETLDKEKSIKIYAATGLASDILISLCKLPLGVFIGGEMCLTATDTFFAKFAWKNDLTETTKEALQVSVGTLVSAHIALKTVTTAITFPVLAKAIVVGGALYGFHRLVNRVVRCVYKEFQFFGDHTQLTMRL